MTDKVISASPEDGIRDTFFAMRRENVRHMPVINESGALLGIISDRDLRRPEWVDEAPDVSHMYNLDNGIAVQELMSRNPIVVHTYDRIRKATRLLLKHRFGALPVLDKEDRVVGMLSAVDLLRALDEMLSQKK